MLGVFAVQNPILREQSGWKGKRSPPRVEEGVTCYLRAERVLLEGIWAGVWKGNRSWPGEERRAFVCEEVKEALGLGCGERQGVQPSEAAVVTAEGRAGGRGVTFRCSRSLLERQPGLHDPVLPVRHLGHHHGYTGLCSAAHLHPPLPALLRGHPVFRLQ